MAERPLIVRSALERLPWREVRSTNVRRIAYVRAPDLPEPPVRPADAPEKAGTLYVEFHGAEQLADGSTAGRVYRYLNVPLNVFRELYEADSAGRAFRALVKDRYPTARVAVSPDPSTPQSQRAHQLIEQRRQNAATTPQEDGSLQVLFADGAILRLGRGGEVLGTFALVQLAESPRTPPEVVEGGLTYEQALARADELDPKGEELRVADEALLP